MMFSRSIATLVPRSLVAAAFLVLGASQAAADEWYVRAPPWAGGDGTSWATAFNSLQVALAIAAPGDEIRVAAGVYVPGTSRSDAFIMDGLLVRGGFPRTGGPVPDPEAHPTVLSGEIGVAGNLSDNSYHVVRAFSSTLDGFVIRRGNADATSPVPEGGGVYATGQVELRRCKFVENRAQSGGGVYFVAVPASDSLVVTDCVFRANSAVGPTLAGLGLGGGLFSENFQGELGGSVVIDRSSFLGNSAVGVGGGLASTTQSFVWNTVFSGNHAGGPGGGLHVTGTGSSVLNSTIASNESNYALGAGGAFLTNSALANSILFGNTAFGGSTMAQQLVESLVSITHCDTEGGAFPGTGNISSNPGYRNALGDDGVAGTLDDDLRLGSRSPCLDAGDNAYAALPQDRDNTLRVRKSSFGGARVVDMGAYEHTTRSSPGLFF